MTNILKYLLFTIIPLLMATSCQKDEEDTPPQVVERTVIVYMVAENDLNINCLHDLSEMTDGAKNLGNDANLIVYVDRLSTEEKPYIAKIGSNGIKKVRTYSDDGYSSDPKIMAEALQWIIKNYPAKSYGLVAWGHADGWNLRDKSFSFAKGNNLMLANAKPLSLLPDGGFDNGLNNKMMNITSFCEALSALPHFDYIFFDCCNMQSAEVVYQLRNKCDYVIASPSEIPGEGAPYDVVVRDLFLPKEQVGKNLVDDYINYTDFQQKGCGLPLSVAKTSNMEALAHATMEALGKFSKNFIYPIEPPVSQCIYYNKNDYTFYSKAMFDMRDFMFRNLSTEDFAQWDDCFKKAVIYAVHPEKEWATVYFIDFNEFTMTDDNFGGMSMFVPQKAYSKDGIENPNIQVMKMDWAKIVDWSKWGWNR